jgi:hypothetical protein
MKALLALVVVLVCGLAQASEGSFAKLVKGIESNSSAYLFYRVEKSQFSNEQLAKMNVFANYGTRSWGDTILEGDYMASSEQARLDVIEGVYSGSTLVAFKIIYSLKAWSTGSCDVDYNAINGDGSNLDQVLAECDLGRIYGSSYVDVGIHQTDDSWSEPRFEDKY